MVGFSFKINSSCKGLGNSTQKVLWWWKQENELLEDLEGLSQPNKTKNKAIRGIPSSLLQQTAGSRVTQTPFQKGQWLQALSSLIYLWFNDPVYSMDRRVVLSNVSKNRKSIVWKKNDWHIRKRKVGKENISGWVRKKWTERNVFRCTLKITYKAKHYCNDS